MPETINLNGAVIQVDDSGRVLNSRTTNEDDEQ